MTKIINFLRTKNLSTKIVSTFILITSVFNAHCPVSKNPEADNSNPLAGATSASASSAVVPSASISNASISSSSQAQATIFPRPALLSKTIIFLNELSLEQHMNPNLIYRFTAHPGCKITKLTHCAIYDDEQYDYYVFSGPYNILRGIRAENDFSYTNIRSENTSLRNMISGNVPEEAGRAFWDYLVNNSSEQIKSSFSLVENRS